MLAEIKTLGSDVLNVIRVFRPEPHSVGSANFV